MSRLRDLQIEWNNMVPAAQARGIRGVREVRLYPAGLHERIPHRQARVDWLRRELGLLSSTTTLSTPVSVGNDLHYFTFGVELEFSHPRVSRWAIVEAIKAAGIDIRDETYNHGIRSWWKITTDGSLGLNYSANSEIVSPILQGDDGFSQTATVCRVLKSLGVKVNKKCGFHVHLGAANENVDFFKNLVKNYAAAQTTIDQVLAPSRRGYESNFCRPVQYNASLLEMARTPEEVMAAANQSNTMVDRRSNRRYRKLNLQSYLAYKTVEFRHHQGTIEGEKVLNWVRFVMRLALASKRGQAIDVGSLETLMSSVNANETEARYFNSRKSFFDRAANGHSIF
jgi:hypothetical protein